VKFSDQRSELYAAGPNPFTIPFFGFGVKIKSFLEMVRTYRPVIGTDGSDIPKIGTLVSALFFLFYFNYLSWHMNRAISPGFNLSPEYRNQ